MVGRDETKIKNLRSRIEMTLIDDLVTNHNYAIEKIAGWCLQLCQIVEELHQKIIELGGESNGMGKQS